MSACKWLTAFVHLQRRASRYTAADRSDHGLRQHDGNQHRRLSVTEHAPRWVPAEFRGMALVLHQRLAETDGLVDVALRALTRSSSAWHAIRGSHCARRR